jgi:diguanylate cyclase (GGDEF)-like protein
MHMIRRMGVWPRSPEPFGLVYIQWVDPRKDTPGGRAAPGEGRAGLILEKCRETLRKTDYLCQVDPATLAVVVDAEPPQLHRIADRLLLRFGEKELLERAGVPACPAIRFGFAAFAQNGKTTRTVLGEAWKNLKDAVRAGVPYVLPETEERQRGGKASGWKPESSKEQKRWLDELTGVLKQDHVDAVMQKYIAHFRRDGHPVSMLVVGVDFLYRYRDHYGAAVQETILRTMGQFLESCVREDDIIGRYGDEEFIIGADCAPVEACKMGLRITAGMKTRPVMFDKSELKISVSAGTAGFPDHGGVARKLVAAAAVALHHSGGRGRGTCVMYDPSMETEADGRNKEVL